MSHWHTEPLGEFVATKKGSVDPSKFPDEEFDLYSIPAFDSGHPEARVGNEIGSVKQIVEPNDVLLSRIVPHIRRAWVVGGSRGRRLIASGEWIVFRSSRLKPAFLRYFLLGAPFHNRFMQTVSGVGGSLLRAKASEVAKIPIPVPPLEEQERIVALLDEADELRKLRAQADRRTGDLIPALFHEMSVDADSKDWKERNFGDAEIIEIIDGDRGNSYPKKTDFQKVGHCLFLNTSNVRTGLFDLSRCDFIVREKDVAMRKGKLSRGDVVLTTRGTLGNSAHYNDRVPYEDVRINSGMVILRTDTAVLLPEYLLMVLNSHGFKRQVAAMTSGSAQQQLPINRLSQIKFVVPPVSFQKKLVQRMTEIRAMEAEQAASRQRLDDLFQSMLHRAFANADEQRRCD